MKTLDVASSNMVLTITDICFINLRPTRVEENLDQKLSGFYPSFQFQALILTSNVRKIDLEKSALDDLIFGVLLRFVPIGSVTCAMNQAMDRAFSVGREENPGFGFHYRP